MRVRLAKPLDFESIFLLLKELWPKKTLHKDRMRKVFMEHIHNPYQAVLVVVEPVDEDVMGMAAITSWQDFFDEGRMMRLDELVIRHDKRGQGVGSILLKQVEKIARKHTSLIILDTATYRKRAHKFYRKHGYVKTDYCFEKKLKK